MGASPTGKEEDVEIGLQYFGKRFLLPQLGRWVSADPLAVHVPGEADDNVYAYVHGRVLIVTDPVGLKDGDNPVRNPDGTPGSYDADDGCRIGIDCKVPEQSDAADKKFGGEQQQPRTGATAKMPKRASPKPAPSAGKKPPAPGKSKISDDSDGSDDVPQPDEPKASNPDPCGGGGNTCIEGTPPRAQSSESETGDPKAGKGKAPGKKRGPKTDPDAPHNAKIRQRVKELEAEGNRIIAGGGTGPRGTGLKERLIPTPGGKKAGRRPDILYETPKKEIRGENIGKANKRGKPITREQEALDDLIKFGRLPTTFTPYNR